jgi:hypothetical protein
MAALIRDLFLLGGAFALVAYWLRVREVQRADDAAQHIAEIESDQRFEPASIEQLPAPARRYFLHAIIPGTRLARSVALTMEGRIRWKKGTTVQPFAAHQVFAPPRGSVWKATVGRWPFMVSGFEALREGRCWARWWRYGVLPVDRTHTPDASKSAVGRMAAETFWLPSILHPDFGGARWTGISDERAIVRVTIGDQEIDLTVTIDQAGRIRRLELMRWRQDLARPRFMTWVVEEFDDEVVWGGYRIPRRARAGWKDDDDAVVPVYWPQLQAARYR